MMTKVIEPEEQNRGSLEVLIIMTKKGKRLAIAIEDFSEIGTIMMTKKYELSK